MRGGASAGRIILSPACASVATAGITRWPTPFRSLRKERIRKRIYATRELAIAEIDEYIEIFYNRTRRHSHNTLSKRMNDIQQASPGSDPVLQELQALDLSGRQLHQPLWVLQRGHLVLTRDTPQQSQGSREEQAQPRNQWQPHRRQHVKALEDIRRQRHQLEGQHLDVEARLIEPRLH